MGLITPVSEGRVPFLIIIDLLIAISCSELVTQVKIVDILVPFIWKMTKPRHLGASPILIP